MQYNVIYYYLDGPLKYNKSIHTLLEKLCVLHISRKLFSTM